MSAPIYVFGRFQVDMASRRLRAGDDVVSVTVKAFDILAALIEHAGHVVEKDELMRRVWPDAIVEEANLSQQIFLLRKALGEGPKDPRFIATVPRRGYRFVAEVSTLRETPSPPLAASPESERVAVPIEMTAPVLRLQLPLDPPLRLAPSRPFALSPNGRVLAYIAEDNGCASLAIRRLDGTETRRLPRTEGATSPFFSPDSQWIGYFANGRLRRIPACGGTPIDICEAGGECRGASWSCHDEIVLAPTPASGLVCVPAEGGRPRPVTNLDFASGERTHRWPECLPDGRSVLLTIARAGSVSFEEAEIAVASLETGERRIVHRYGSGAQYLRTGHLAYARGGSLMAVPFDLGRLAVTGSSIPVADAVMTQPTGAGYFSASQEGSLVHLSGQAQEVVQRLVWSDGEGLAPAGVEDRFIEEPRIAPDGSRIVFGIRHATSDIWTLDPGRNRLRRLTFEADNFAPIWTRDGRHVTFSSNRLGPCQIFMQALEDSEPTLIVGGEHDLVPGSWALDGVHLLFTEYNPQSGAGIWMCNPKEDVPPHALVKVRGNAFAPACSPDGRQFAYTSDESGRLEVWIASFPGAEEKWQVSHDGGSEPVWSRDGGSLFFRNGSGVYALDVSSDRHAARPVQFAEGAFQPGAATGLPNYDVASDGRLLLVAQSRALTRPDHLDVTVRWFSDIARRFA